MASSRLADRVALITGAGSGIGYAVASRFVAEGARVVALDCSRRRLDTLSRALGDHVVGIAGDVRDSDANERAVAAARASFGYLDIFVGNAGVFDARLPLRALDAATLQNAADEIFGVNVVGPLLGVRAALGSLAERRGAIVLTVSDSGLHPGAGGGILYATAKHAVVGIVRQLAYELAPEVRVNGVSPGGTMTDLRVASRLRELTPSLRHFRDPEASMQGIRATNPLHIVAEPEDHVGAYVLLASDEARAITGEVIASDGGLGVRGLDLHPERPWGVD